MILRTCFTDGSQLFRQISKFSVDTHTSGMHCDDRRELSVLEPLGGMCRASVDIDDVIDV